MSFEHLTKTIGVLFMCSLLFACTPEEKKMPHYEVQNRQLGVSLTCVNGYVFAIFERSQKGGITQFWEVTPDGGARPLLCGGEYGVH